MSEHFITVSRLEADEVIRHTDALSRILADSVLDGAAISFMTPLPKSEADTFWTETVRKEVAAGDRVLLVARKGDDIVGTVQLLVSMPPNQPHRAEISKMIVHPEARRMGVGRSLMNAVLDTAKAHGKKLVTLDTRPGDPAESLYRSLGFEVAGTIPDFAFDPDGRALHATMYMYRRV